MSEDVNRNADTEELMPEILAVVSSTRDSDNHIRAAKALKDKAEELGVSIRIEIHENTDIKDPLTDKQIQECKGIIVATDTNLALRRFSGKQVLVTTTSQAISEPEKLIETILNDEAPFTKKETSKIIEGNPEETEKENKQPSASAERMSLILPYLVSGSFMLVMAMLLSKDTGSPAYLFFRMTGETIYGLLIPVIGAGIAYMLAGKNALVCGLIGGVLGKAGYTFAWLMDQSTPIYSGGILSGVVAGLCSAFITIMFQKLCSRMSSSTRMICDSIICPIISAIVISAVMFAFNGVLSTVNHNIVDLLGNAGINEEILALAILLVSIIICVAVTLKERKQDS